MDNQNVKIREMLSMVEQGQLNEAQHKYFAENVSSQEANNEPIQGKEAVINGLIEFQESNNVTGFRGYDIHSISNNNNESHYTATLKLEVNGGEPVDIQQAVYTQWMNGQVVFERYYHA